MFKIYLSHPIRGAKGANATREDMEANNKIAIVIGKAIERWYRDKFPNEEISVYIPGEHDEFVMLGYENGTLTEKQILDIDCQIITTCDMVYALSGEVVSHGMQVEIDFANDHNIPVFYAGIPKVNDVAEAEPPEKKDSLYSPGDILYGTVWLKKWNEFKLVKFKHSVNESCFSCEAITPLPLTPVGQVFGSAGYESWRPVSELNDVIFIMEDKDEN